MKPRLLAVAIVACLLVSPLAMARSTRAVLEQKLPDLKFQGVALNDCVDFLRDVSGANIHVNWKALEGVGVDKNTPVNLRLRYVTIRRVLSLLLSETGASDQLTFYIDEGVIEITTRELADKQVFTRVYPIEDLLLEVPDFDQAPDFNLGNNGSGSGGTTNGNNNRGGDRGGGGGMGIFSSSGSSTSGGSGGRSGSGSGGTGTTKAERAQALIDMICDIIQPDIWRKNGGTASIQFYNGSLIVTAPRSVHEALGGPID